MFKLQDWVDILTVKVTVDIETCYIAMETCETAILEKYLVEDFEHLWRYYPNLQILEVNFVFSVSQGFLIHKDPFRFIV